MNNDQEKPLDKTNTIFTNKKKDIDIFKRCSFMPDLFTNEEDNSSKRKPYIERTTRSQSHYHFYCRPEFVPKPKPKRACVIPSPMKLKNKFVSSKNESDHCFSPLESEGEQLCLEEVENDTINIDKELAMNNLRKTLNKIKASPPKKQAKDCEEVLRNSIGFNKIKRKSVFTKTIKGFIEDEKENNKNALKMSIEPVNIQKNISILSVLVQTAGNLSPLNLTKCKSTIL